MGGKAPSRLRGPDPGAGERHAGGARQGRQGGGRGLEDSGSVRILLEGASSSPGLAEVTYQLGLCKHEKAEQAQARLGLLGRERGGKVPALEIEDVNTAWMDALGWWKKYGDDHPQETTNRHWTKPGRAAAVRRMRARPGDARRPGAQDGPRPGDADYQAAVATLEGPKEPPLFPLEKLAALYGAAAAEKEGRGPVAARIKALPARSPRVGAG